MTEEFIDLTDGENVETSISETEIEVSEATGWTSGDVARHINLPDRNESDQHIITSITGLRDELDEIESLKSAYSDKIGAANYYEWKDGLRYDEAGYFVSLVPGESTIQICSGSDIFGVTVPDAGFVGNQAYEEVRNSDGTFRKVKINRDNTHALVATSGLVHVRCESGVVAGDYVVSGVDGIAVKTDSGCGYKVASTAAYYDDDDEDDGGVPYAIISLGVQACTTDAMGQTIQHLGRRINDAEINIAAIALVADEAYSKSENVENSTSEDLKDISDKVDNANKNASHATGIGEMAQTAANNALKIAQDVRDEANRNHKEALETMGGIEETIDPIRSWVHTDPVTGEPIYGAQYFDQYVENGLSTKADMDTVDRLDEENKLLIEKNAEAYQQTMASVDKYVIGEYSQAYGLTVEQARKALNDGMVYIPTEHKSGNTHTEKYVFESNGKKYACEIQFTKGGYYVWRNIPLKAEAEDGEKIDISGYMWTAGVGEVLFSNIAPSVTRYDFWYHGGKLYKAMVPTWKNIAKFVWKSASEPDGTAFAYWFDGSVVRVCGIDDEGAVTWREGRTLIGETDPTDEINDAYEFYCCRDKIYERTDALWTEFDKNVWYGELDPGSSEYNYCFYNNVLSVLSLDTNGNKYWRARATYVGEDAPSYETYDFWYEKKEDEETGVLRSLWCEVNTLAGNANSRITSMIRHDVDSITNEIVNAHGSVTDFGLWLTETESIAKMGTFWVDPESGEKTTANLGLQSNDDGSTMSLIVRDQDGNDTTLGGASITLGTNAEDSYVTIDADRINIEGKDIDFSAANSVNFSADQYKVMSDNIVLTGDSFKVYADDILFEGEDGSKMTISADNIEFSSGLGGRNYIIGGKGNVQTGFFKNFDSVTDDYGIAWLTSYGAIGANNSVNFIQLGDGFSLGCREYEVGRTMVWSYDIMYTLYELPDANADGIVGQEFWMGQRYRSSSTATTSESGAWRGVTKHNMPRVGENGCELDEWYHVKQVITIPEPADESIDTYETCIKFYSGSTELDKGAQVRFRIKNVKLEYGNIATDWTPAPEDTVGTNQVGTEMHWRMLPEKCVWWNNVDGTNSESFPLMRLDGGGLYINGEGKFTGQIEASKGVFGSCDIEEDGYINTDGDNSYVRIESGYMKCGTQSFDLIVSGNSATGYNISKITSGSNDFETTASIDGKAYALTSHIGWNPTMASLEYIGNQYLYVCPFEIDSPYGRLTGNWSGTSGFSTDSDATLKHDIEQLSDNYSELFNSLKPVRYKYNNGTSNRFHTGFIAQDVMESINESGLSTQDFAALTKIGNTYSLRYEEFVSLNTWQIQKLKTRVAELEKTIEELKTKLD